MEQNQQEEMQEPQDNQQEEAPEDAGRGTDTVIGHLSLGEIVIPRAMQDDPQFMQILQSAFQQAGMDINEFTVGDKANKINPDTEYPEFFSLGKIFKKIVGVAAPVVGGIFGGPVGAALGGGLGSALNGGSLGQDLLSGGLSGIGAGLTGTGGSLFDSGGALEGSALGDVNSGITNALSPIGSGISDAISGAKSFVGNGLSSATDSLGLTSPNVGSALQGSSTFDPSNLASNSTNIGSFLSGNSGAPLTNLTSLGGLSGGGSGGGSTFGNFNTGGSIASALSGFGQNSAIKKAQQQLLASNAAQQANLSTFDPSNITNDAGYQFNLQQGQQGLDRSAAAGGDLFSGKALKAASQYNQNYANNALQSAYQRWLDQTGAQNQLIGNQGNINAQGTVAGANALTTGLSGALNPTSGLSSQDLLKLLGKQQTGGLYG